MTSIRASQKPNLASGYSAAILSAAILSTTGILIRYLTETYQMPSLVLAFWRDLIVALALVAVLLLTRRPLPRIARRDQAYFAAFGLVLALFNTTWTASVAVNGAAVATVLAYCSAGFTVILGWLLLRESLTWVKILVVLLSLSGTVMVSGAYNPVDWQTNPGGILLGLFSGLGYAGYTIMGRSASQRGVRPWTSLLYTFGWAALFLLAFNLIPGIPLPGKANQIQDLAWLGRAGSGWLALVFLAIGPTVFGFGLYNISLTHLSSGITNLIVTTEPVFTGIIAYSWLGERFTSVQIVGSLVILAAVFFLRLKGAPD